MVDVITQQLNTTIVQCLLRLEIVFVGWIKPILRYPPLPNDEVMEPHSGRFDVVTSNDSSDMARSGLDYAALVDNGFSR